MEVQSAGWFPVGSENATDAGFPLLFFSLLVSRRVQVQRSGVSLGLINLHDRTVGIEWLTSLGGGVPMSSV